MRSIYVGNILLMSLGLQLYPRLQTLDVSSVCCKSDHWQRGVICMRRPNELCQLVETIVDSEIWAEQTEKKSFIHAGVEPGSFISKMKH